MPRRAAPSVLLLLAIACAPAAPPPSGTADDGWGPSLANDAKPPDKPVVPRALPIPESQRKRWARADEIAELSEVPGRSRSEHLDGRFDRTVLANAAAASYGAPGGVAMPVGALVIQRHHPRGSEKVVALFVMEKSPKGWDFLVLDEKLRVAAESNLRLCARCHADAPYDSLFGLGVEPIDEP